MTSIVPNENSFGRIKTPRIPDRVRSGEASREEALRAVTELLSGALAEARHVTGSFPALRELLITWLGETDSFAAAEIGQRYGGGEAFYQATLDLACELLGSEEGWRAVEAVARALLRDNEISAEAVCEVVAQTRLG